MSSQPTLRVIPMVNDLGSGNGKFRKPSRKPSVAIPDDRIQRALDMVNRGVEWRFAAAWLGVEVGQFVKAARRYRKRTNEDAYQHFKAVKDSLPDLQRYSRSTTRKRSTI